MVSSNFDIKVDDKITLENLKRLSDKFNSLDLESWMKGELLAYLHTRASNRFSSEGDDAVGRWLPLSTATQAIRAGAGFGPAHPINVRTGDLKSFMMGDPGQFAMNSSYAELKYPGSPSTQALQEKLSTAQTGRGNPATPKRPVVGLGPTDIAEIDALFSIFITTGLL